MKNKQTIITRNEQFENNFDKEVTIEGVYHLMNVSKRPGTVVFTKRVYIELEDKNPIILETHDEGLRSQEEIDEFKGHKVKVTGTLVSRRTIWGDGSEASIVGICLVNIQSIEKKK